MASARAPAPGGQGAVTVTTSAPCTWCRPSRCGRRRALGRRRRGWRGRLRASSWLERLQFRLANGPVLTPPRRVKKPWRTGRIGLVRASGVIRSNPGGVGRAGWQSAQGLEQAAHRTGSARRWAAWIRAAARAGGWRAGEAVGALEQAEAGEEDALRDGAVHGGAGGAGGLGEGGEVDMGGEVGRAGVGERVGGAAVADRLQGVAGRAVGGAVVEEQGGAAAGGEAARRGRRSRARAGSQISTISAFGERAGRGRGPAARRSAPSLDVALGQASPRRTNWRMGRASRNSLASRISGPGGQVVGGVVPGGVGDAGRLAARAGAARSRPGGA